MRIEQVRVDKDFSAHKSQEPVSVEFWFDGTNKFLIASQKPNFELGLHPLLKVKSLQIINHSNVIYKIATSRLESMSISEWGMHNLITLDISITAQRGYFDTIVSSEFFDLLDGKQ